MQREAAKGLKGDPLQRIAGFSLIVGAVVLLVFSALTRFMGASEDLEEYFGLIADQSTPWAIVHLLVAAGFWAMMIGAAGVHRSISTGTAAVWARVGFYGVVLGTALWTAQLALSGFGLPAVVEPLEVATGTDRVAVFNVAVASYRMIAGLQSMAIVVYWLGLASLGVGMTIGKVYASWVGWAAIVLGSTTAAVGAIWAATGLSLWPVYAVLSALTLVWALALGIGITLGARQSPAADSTETVT